MENKMAMIGLGYIGLPTAAVIAQNGWTVIGVDVNPSVVQKINQGEIHIVESGLDVVVSQVVRDKLLSATTTYPSVGIYVVAVPTPTDIEHNADITYVIAAMKKIASVMPHKALVILESTSPVGTTEKMMEIFSEQHPNWRVGEDYYLAYCPERVLPGKVLHELVHNPRIVGGITPSCTEKAMSFYKSFVKGDCLEASARMAEMAKLTENSYRDVNIAFANELSMICDRLGLDPFELIKLANRHPRVNILQPGAGVGGHCIAVDPWFIVQAAPEQALLIKQARLVNDYKPIHVYQKVRNEILNHPKGKSAKVGVLGLSFKPDIDDLRESPALEIAEMIADVTILHENGLFVIEPHIQQLPKSLSEIQHVSLCKTEQIMDFDIIVVLVKHSCFQAIWSSEELNSKNIVVIDAVGMGK